MMSQTRKSSTLDLLEISEAEQEGVGQAGKVPIWANEGFDHANGPHFKKGDVIKQPVRGLMQKVLLPHRTVLLPPQWGLLNSNNKPLR